MDGQDLESSSSSTSSSSAHYSPIPTSDAAASHPPPRRRPSWTLLTALATSAALLMLLSLSALFAGGRENRASTSVPPTTLLTPSRGVSAGVSEKSTGPLLGSTPYYPWTNTMLLWQRTTFHFQPQQNWMNDPDGPMYYKGWYHLFYQYNPDSAVWGNITWGHAVSRDLIHWLYLPLALVPDRWYDAGGVWTGSATFIPPSTITEDDGGDGLVPIMLYTSSTNESVQVQCIATPADPSDPLLLEWVKSDANPVLFPPPGIGDKDFRDPTTAWLSSVDSTWHVAIGSKDADHAGITLVYKTEDFIDYDLLPGVLHAVPNTGMWECVDFYPVSTEKAAGLHTSTPPAAGVKHVLKASLDDDKHDYYAIGTYCPGNESWVPDDPEIDVGIGLRYDWGKYYASKTFYDPAKNRRVLWGWIGETDSEHTDLLKGWASVQTVPRTVLFDEKTWSNLLLWPVEEVESLRLSSVEFDNIKLDIGAVMPINISTTTHELDIEAEFTFEPSTLAGEVEADVGYNCSTSGGASGRGVLGPFGLLILADDNLVEQTAVYFYISRGTDGSLQTFFCQDELRSSLANDLVKRVYGSTVPVLDGETLSVRILVDHSIVESFAQRGRASITSRLYPTQAIYNAAGVYLFNNATGGQVTAKSLKIWEMGSASIHPYPGI